MSLQSRSRKLAEKRRSNQKKRTELEQSLKLEKLKALDKTSGKGKNKESGIKRIARKNQIKALEKKVNKPTTKKTTPGNVMPKPRRATDKGGRSAVPGTMRGKQVDTKMGPNMSKVNKPDAKRNKAVRDVMPKPTRIKGPSGPTMTSMKAPSTGPKPRNKDKKVDLKKRGPSRPSMTGFRSGGKVRGDGVCRKGKTKGRMV